MECDVLLLLCMYVLISSLPFILFDNTHTFLSSFTCLKSVGHLISSCSINVFKLFPYLLCRTGRQRDALLFISSEKLRSIPE